MRQQGLTLLELLVALLILGVLMSIGIPSLSHQLRDNCTRTAAYSLYEALQLTRNQAVSHNQRATLRPSGDWQNGWEVFLDLNNNGVRDGQEAVVAVGNSLSCVNIAPNTPLRHYVSFIGTGESRYVGSSAAGGFQAGTFIVCPVEAGAGFELVLARSGRVRMNTRSAELCNG